MRAGYLWFVAVFLALTCARTRESPADNPPSARTVLLARTLTADQRRELASTAPGVRVVDGLTPAAALAHAAAAHGVESSLATKELVARAPKLAWVLVGSSGIDGELASLRALPKSVVVTNMRGAAAPAVADHALALLLSLTRAPRKTDRTEKRIALEGKTMLVVGYGEIGSRIGTRARGFGMKVRGIKKTAGTIDGVEVGTIDKLRDWLPAADVVVLALPLTSETRHVIDDKMLGLFKPEAYLINVGRGALVDTDALVRALRARKLAGAGLDVTEPEPLPANHPLLAMPNVIVTPHVAARSDITEQRIWELLKDNLRRFGRGLPLEQVVDVAAGF